MAKRGKGSNAKSILLVVLIILFLLSVFALKNKISLKSKAVAPSNLNTSSYITSTVNSDNTMGSTTWYGNFSNSLPPFQKGYLSFNIIDPPQSEKANEHAKDNPSSDKKPSITISLPTQTQGGEQGKNSLESTRSSQHRGGPQIVTSLNLTISKVEVHLAHLGTSATPKPTNQPKGYWETLNITNPTTVDLVKLANTGNIASLGLTNLATGRYTEVRLYVNTATAILTDGKQINLTLLGKDKIVRVVRSFVVTAGQTTKLTMDFDAQRSVVKAGNKYLLRPVVARLLQD